jgi:hypothetical protein
MPTVLRVGGHRFFFYSEERREPPHIHVKAAENYAKFWLEPVRLSEAYGYNSRELLVISRIVEENKELFLDAWNEHFKG